MDQQETVFETRNLYKTFQSNFDFVDGLLARFSGRKPPTVRAVQDVSLKVRKGETLGIVGESGCGKSTLARMIAGISRATSGEMYYRGQEFQDFLKNTREALNIQMIFQDPLSSINPRHQVMDIIGEAPVVHGIVPRSGMRDYVLSCMETVGLSPDYAGRYPHQFSGGQRQRIGIARALAVNPELLLCDEAVAALDVSVQAQIVNLFMDIKEKFDLTVVFISHDLGVIRHLCDRVMVMYLGRVVEIAETAELFENPQHPYTKMLLAGMPKISLDRRKFLPIQGEIPSPLNPPDGCYFHPRCPLKVPECETWDPHLMEGENGHAHACLRA